MVASIPGPVKAIWQRYNLRGSIMLSLSLQVFLIFSAPSRKRSSNIWLIFLIWSAYVLADFVALFTLGLISNKQDKELVAQSGGGRDGDLLALWAPFCLLHLGGPDTITAFSLQDNSLWVRHLAALLIQVIVAVYTFVESLPNNGLWVPISFLFVAGIIKYAERTRALYLANLGDYRPDPGPNYAKLMQEFAAKLSARLPAKIRMALEQRDKSVVAQFLSKGQTVDDVDAVLHGSYFFKIFTKLIVDQLVLLVQDLNESRIYFLGRKPAEAFQVVSIELNFFYEVLYTKAAAVHCKRGRFFRAVSVAAVVVSLSLFVCSTKRGFHRVDVGITYILYCGAVALEIAALLTLVFSDWTVYALRRRMIKKGICKLLKYYIKQKATNWPDVPPNGAQKKFRFQRWSEHVSGFNFVEYCVREMAYLRSSAHNTTPCRKLMNIIHDHWRKFYLKAIIVLGLQKFREKRKYVTRKQLTESLWSFIFKELKTSAELYDRSKLMPWATRDWILRNSNYGPIDLIKTYVLDVDYDQSLLLWHIATEICYNKTPDCKENRRLFSKTLSDYMLYLLLIQPTLLSSVGGIGRQTFGDTWEEAKRFFAWRSLNDEEKVEDRLLEACNRIMEMNTDIRPSEVKGSKSKSVLFDACRLAKELEKIEDKDEKWKFVSRVWVDLLSYAACGCRPEPHAELLARGGELITHVWLLLAHFGIGRQLYVSDNKATAKLVVAT